MKLSSGIARIGELQRAGVNVALGTDGAASANDLDLWMAMRLAAFVQHLPARAVVRMATIDGARALGIDHLVGSLEVGKRADVVMLDANAPSLTPLFDPLSSIAYAGSRAEVDTVVVDGRVVVRGGRMVDIDVPALLAEVRAFAVELS